ncbi:PAS domain S-box protein, partial [Thiotrichales bacterium HSG1]|nr:PAS domain S-box protein [Thiotrichales bacterium HSG1]
MPTSFSLNQKIIRFLITYLMLLLPVIAIGVTVYYSEVKTNKISSEIQANENLRGQFELILAEFKHITSELLFLSENNAIQDLLNTNSAKQNLATEYLNFITHKKIYDQVRFLDTTGLEIVRANFNKGKPFIVPEEKLQNKSGRYYFEDTFVLKQGEIFISPFDLNVERGEVEQPIKPMLRFGTPIFDQYDNKRGILLLNYLGKNLLEQMRKLAIKNFSDIMLLNKKSFWLLSPNKDDEWGFMSEQGLDKNFSNRFFNEWQVISSQKSGQFYTTNGLFTFTTIYPLANGYKSHFSTVKTKNSGNSKFLKYHWKLVSHIPSSVLKIDYKQILSSISLLFIELAMLMSLVALVLTYIGIKHVEAKAFLKYNEEQLRTLIEGVIGYAIILLDARGNITSWNSGAERILQYTADEIIGKHLSIFHPPENIKNGKVEQILTNATENGKTENEGYRLRKNGSKYLAHVTVTALYKPDGTLRGFTHVTRDITERRNSEERLLQSEMMFRSLYESSSDAIMLLDENGFFDCNQITLKLFGCNSKEQFISCHPSDFSPLTQFNGEDSKTLADKYIQIAITKGSHSFEWSHCRLDGTTFHADVSLNS